MCTSILLLTICYYFLVTEKLCGDDADTQYDEIIKDIEDAKSLPKITVKEMIQQKKLRRPLIIICFLMFAQQLSGINAVSIKKIKKHMGTHPYTHIYI